MPDETVKPVKPVTPVLTTPTSLTRPSNTGSYSPIGKIAGLAVTLAYNFVGAAAQSPSPSPSCNPNKAACDAYLRCSGEQKSNCVLLLTFASLIIAAAFVSTCAFAIKKRLHAIKEERRSSEPLVSNDRASLSAAASLEAAYGATDEIEQETEMQTLLDLSDYRKYCPKTAQFLEDLYGPQLS